MSSIDIETKNQLIELAKGNPPPEDAGIFGADISPDIAQLVIIPVPFELTTSYGKGTKNTPELIFEPSHQLDLFDPLFGNPYKVGICVDNDDGYVRSQGEQAQDAAARVIAAFEKNVEPSVDDLELVNRTSKTVNDAVYKRACELIDCGKMVALLGGDHSVSYGLVKALADHSKLAGGFGILHFDAHHDLRVCYEGFNHSHASIMYNILESIPAVTSLVSLGIRDFSEQEYAYARNSPRVHTLYDREKNDLIANGKSFAEIIDPFLDKLPDYVYISFDIDGLDPALCPHTGTPVPGGLSYQDAMWILERLIEKKKKVIGFDLCEVAPDPDSDWDLNVGARVLYKLCGTLVKSVGLKDLV
jgi:agmatinase